VISIIYGQSLVEGVPFSKLDGNVGKIALLVGEHTHNPYGLHVALQAGISSSHDEDQRDIFPLLSRFHHAHNATGSVPRLCRRMAATLIYVNDKHLY
jgi:hypothetical protein